LPHPLHTTGIGWVTVTLVLVALSLVLFTGELRGPAAAVTSVDDAIVGWLAGLNEPGLSTAMKLFAALGSWVAITVLLWGLLLALLVLKRLRHLLVVVAAWALQGLIVQYILGPVLSRPRPFGVVFGTDWYGWAMPSEQMAALSVTLVGILYAIVPEGRRRQTGKWAAVAVIMLVATARMHLGVEAPSDVVVGVVIGVTVPLLGFRLFAPNESFPVTYRRGRAAHLDIGGERGEAIRRALAEQLGVVVEDVEPFGLEGSAGSTPLRMKVDDDTGTWLFAKLYARSHLRADRWYKLGRELLYGRLEDEKPFHTVRRLVQQEDYALHKLHLAGLPTPRPYGFVELTPEREYLLVTEFFDHATELGDAQIDERVVDDGLAVIRKLWDAGLAHRDIKPANLLVRDRQVLLIDVAFAESRPSPWRQAVDLANMMLCLALRSDPELVYQRASRQFSVAEISEALAAARGLALPSQLRRMLRERGRDIHTVFLNLLPAPPEPIKIQRWGARRIAVLLLMVPVAMGLAFSFRTVLVNNDATTTPLAIDSLRCDQLEPLWLEAQSVPSASLVPCIRSLPEGWTFGAASVRNGWARFTLDHDRIGRPALVVRLAGSCDVSAATPASADRPGTRRYVRTEPGGVEPTTSYIVFPGGCITMRFRSAGIADASLIEQATSAIGLTARRALQSALDERSNGQLRLDPGDAD
jgi:membrane-associated phospholipid phosphatase/tRNA A-37 threonylcarbamoyl transferase component Bud32